MNLRKSFLFTPAFPVLQGRQYHPCSWWYLAAIAAWMRNFSVTGFVTSHCNRWLFPVKEVTTHCHTPTCMLRTRLPWDMAPPAIFGSFHPKQGRGQKGTRLEFYKLEDNESSALSAYWIIFQGTGHEQMIQFLLPTEQCTNRKCLIKLILYSTHSVMYKNAQLLGHTKHAQDTVFGERIWNLREGMNGCVTH